MVPIRRAASLAALVVAAVSPAVVRAEPQIHIAWDDCGGAGVVTRTFACDTNVGAELLYVSFVPPAGITAFQAIEAKIRLWAAGSSFPPVIPSWWGFRSTQCRPTGLQTQLGFDAGPYSCANPWPSTAAAGAIMDSTFSTGYQSVIKVLAAMPTGEANPSLDPALEYYAFRLVVRHVKSAGLGACDGCSTPIGMDLSYLKLYQYPSGTGDYEYPNPGRSSGVFPYINWQCPGAPLAYPDVGHGGEVTWSIGGWSFTDCATATKPRTWGQIKSLYR